MSRPFFRKLLTYLSLEDDSDIELNEDVDGQSSSNRDNHQHKDPTYPSNLFRRRFRMSRPLFLRILNQVESNESYFVQRRDNVGRLGFSSMQKITATLRMLAYGVTGDFIDEYIRIGESTAMESLKTLCETVVSMFSTEYLRSPNTTILLDCLLLLNNEDSLECLEASIACIGNGTIAPRLGKVQASIRSNCSSKRVSTTGVSLSSVPTPTVLCDSAMPL